MEARIILVRHGETEANRLGCFAASEDIALTDTGREQAEELALKIQTQFRPHKVISSAFHRARQTAVIIARQLGLPVEVIPGIQERDFGCLRGEPYERMGGIMRKDNLYDPERRWLWAPEGGESLEEVRLRAIGALEKIQTCYPQEEVVVVSHGAVMESVVAHLANNWKTACVPPNCGMVLVESGSLQKPGCFITSST
ncbi:MAG: Phosphoglycerate mutase [Bryobacterales bacterium]|nr:Phosphoglycerate mutase [Bryobacterales bacterium]